MRSRRLVYRPFAPADTDELVALFRDPEVRRYLLDDRRVDEEWVRDEIASSAERFDTSGVGLWSIRLREDSVGTGNSTDIEDRGTYDAPSLEDRPGPADGSGPGENGRIIGFVGFREFFHPPRLQLLYGLHPTYWGRGLATEAARRICEHGFRELGFTRIEAATDVRNQASARVLLRLGMRPDPTRDDETSGTRFYGMHP